MVGKRVQLDDGTFALVNLLRRERRRSFQQLADEAFRDLLVKHGHPPSLKGQLRESVAAAPRKAKGHERAATPRRRHAGDLQAPSGDAVDDAKRE